ncbi:MAG: LptF/LptG family permease [Deltaproteobacteria bacterium]|nr:LptF/LptG family permease [Deltaproteobacteria bacterium]
MRVADSYLLRRVAWPLFAVTLVVGTVVSLWQLSRVSQMVLTSWRDLGLLASLIADLAPGFSGMALGASGIFGCVVAYDRLAEDGELTAMGAAAIPPHRVFRPALLSGLVMALLVLCAGIWGEPWGTAHYARDVALLGTRAFARTLAPGTFNHVGNLASVYVGGAAFDAEGNATLSDVVVGRDLANGPLVLTARSVDVRPAGVGLIHVSADRGEAILPADKPSDLNRMTFDHAELTVDVASWVGEEAMTLHAWQAWPLNRLWEAASSSEHDDAHNKLRFHLWQKLSLPWGMILLCMLGGIFGGQRAPTARGRAYIGSALLVALYFGLLGFGRNLVLQGILPPWLGANVPNLLGAALLAWAWRARATRWT